MAQSTPSELEVVFYFHVSRKHIPQLHLWTWREGRDPAEIKKNKQTESQKEECPEKELASLQKFYFSRWNRFYCCWQAGKWNLRKMNGHVAVNKCPKNFAVTRASLFFMLLLNNAFTLSPFAEKLWWLSIRRVGWVNFLCHLPVMACTTLTSCLTGCKLHLAAWLGCYFWHGKVSASVKAS